MPPAWKVRAGGLAVNSTTCELVIGPCITELLSSWNQKTHLFEGTNNANFRMEISLKFNELQCDAEHGRPGTISDLHSECRIFLERLSQTGATNSPRFLDRRVAVSNSGWSEAVRQSIDTPAPANYLGMEPSGRSRTTESTVGDVSPSTRLRPLSLAR